MVAMLQWQDARCIGFRSKLSGDKFLALFLKIFLNGLI